MLSIVSTLPEVNTDLASYEFTENCGPTTDAESGNEWSDDNVWKLWLCLSEACAAKVSPIFIDTKDSLTVPKSAGVEGLYTGPGESFSFKSS